MASAPSGELANWGRGSMATLQFGNFSGWIDEVAVRSLHSGELPNSAPSVRLTSPAEGTVLFAPAEIVMTANAADSDGSIARVEFYSDGIKLGEAGADGLSYRFVWHDVPAGAYVITAVAVDDRGEPPPRFRWPSR